MSIIVSPMAYHFVRPSGSEETRRLSPRFSVPVADRLGHLLTRGIMERTLVLVKPDGLQRGLVGEIISRLERRGLRLVALKLMRMEGEQARLHYGEHVNRPFFPGLVEFITSAPLVAMVWEADNAVKVVRKTMGDTDPVSSALGTIRGDLGLNIGRNLVHGSDSTESAQREISLFFSPQEILDYTRSIDPWITEP